MSKAQIQRLSLWAACTALSLGVLSLYLQPSFLVMLAEQMWACF
jgi:hypothetical protein